MQDSDAKQTASGTLVRVRSTSAPIFFLFCFVQRGFYCVLIGGKEGPIIGCLSPLPLPETVRLGIQVSSTIVIFHFLRDQSRGKHIEALLAVRYSVVRMWVEIGINVRLLLL